MDCDTNGDSAAHKSYVEVDGACNTESSTESDYAAVDYTQKQKSEVVSNKSEVYTYCLTSASTSNVETNLGNEYLHAKRIKWLRDIIKILAVWIVLLLIIAIVFIVLFAVEKNNKDMCLCATNTTTSNTQPICEITMYVSSETSVNSNTQDNNETTTNLQTENPPETSSPATNCQDCPTTQSTLTATTTAICPDCSSAETTSTILPLSTDSSTVSPTIVDSTSLQHTSTTPSTIPTTVVTSTSLQPTTITTSHTVPTTTADSTSLQPTTTVSTKVPTTTADSTTTVSPTTTLTPTTSVPTSSTSTPTTSRPTTTRSNGKWACPDADLVFVVDVSDAPSKYIDFIKKFVAHLSELYMAYSENAEVAIGIFSRRYDIVINFDQSRPWANVNNAINNNWPSIPSIRDTRLGLQSTIDQILSKSANRPDVPDIVIVVDFGDYQDAPGIEDPFTVAETIRNRPGTTVYGFAAQQVSLLKSEDSTYELGQIVNNPDRVKIFPTMDELIDEDNLKSLLRLLGCRGV